ncbi:acyltransferase domain-containing protein, partial [Wenjunlia tyrosinilytica]|uniref:acyltransferase domain-containing protein n=1 Tax=Wenjunlia tyrosinilytica TaxID=1544741 RepID=UPI00166970C9
VVFAGQGSLGVGAARVLCEAFPVFAEAFEGVVAGVGACVDWSLREVVFGGDAGVLGRTEFAQPALFAFEVALFALLESWGVVPDVVMGHSLGEVTAAYVAGVLGLRDACRVVVGRGRLMQALEPGVMVALPVGVEEVVPLLVGGAVSVAAVNGPSSVVISGPEVEVVAVAGRFGRFRRLEVERAFHSVLVEPALGGFRALLESVELRAPTRVVVSAVTGEVAGSGLMS